jgi:hypothetical protein
MARSFIDESQSNITKSSIGQSGMCWKVNARFKISFGDIGYNHAVMHLIAGREPLSN